MRRTTFRPVSLLGVACLRLAVSLRDLASVLCLVCLFVSFALGAGAQLRAGVAKVNLTPDVKASSIPLGGYAARKAAPATGVASPIYARALVLAQGKAKVALVSVELCFLPANVKSEVLKRVKASGVAGIGAENLLLAATHTHTAPDPLAMHANNTLTDVKGWTRFDGNLLAFTAERIAQAITQAERNLTPARLGSATRSAPELNRNRRNDPLTDPELIALKAEQADGKPLATVINYAAHPTFYDEKALDISPDWTGALSETLERNGGVCLFFNGAEGDAATKGGEGRTPQERIRDYSAKMAARVQEVLPRIVMQSEVTLDAWTQTVTLPNRKPNAWFLVAAMQLGLTTSKARGLVDALMPQETTLGFARIGETLWMGFPCEPTGAIGLEAKRIAREAGVTRPAVVALANDWLAYCLTPAQYKAGNYEASMSFYGDALGPALLAALALALKRTP